VLTGQRIDRKLYDALNAYTDEAGSDGVVRVTGANMNYALLRLQQEGADLKVDVTKRSAETALGILPTRSHSGDDIGIIRSVRFDTAAKHPTAKWVLKCLQVPDTGAYAAMRAELKQLSANTQQQERIETVPGLFGSRIYRTDRYSMVVFRITDDRGNSIDDYDLYLTAGPNYSEQDLPPGFFVDRQRNQKNRGKLTYYINHDVLTSGLSSDPAQGRFGFRLVAYPKETDDSLAFYRPLDFRTTIDGLKNVLVANETLMVDLKLKRCVDCAVFGIGNKRKAGKLFQDEISRKRQRKDVS
jgi:hypothetical protein